MKWAAGLQECICLLLLIIFTVREEHLLRMSENRALRRNVGPKRDNVTGDCRKLHNEELYNMCTLY
jgi:hypothetical protein